MDVEDEDEFDPWTTAGAEALVAAGEALAEAVREHARALAALTQSQDVRTVFAASEVLLPVVLAYADAQFNLTGTSFPFGPLHDLVDDEETGDDDEDEELVGSGLTVLSRQDLVLTDEAAVIAAGRNAYAQLWPEDPPGAASADVTHVGRALYQYAHLNGWDKVSEMTGIVPTGGVTVVQAHEDLLRGDPENWPDDLFAVDAPVLYSQSDVYG